MSSIIDDETLADAYLQLLASSTTSRYLRKATEFARGVATRPTPELISRVRELLPKAETAEKREPAEAELAIALAALAERWDDAEARSIMQEAAQAHADVLNWVSSMARWLCDRRPPTSQEVDTLARQLDEALAHQHPQPSVLDEDEESRLEHPRAA